jgi:hypothetical protein
MRTTGTHGSGDGGGSNGSGHENGAERDEDGLLEARVTALEGAVLAMTREIRTRRLVVIDGSGTPRVVADATGGTAELRLTTTSGRRQGDAAVVLHAGAGPDRPLAGSLLGLDGLVGVQLWADGDAIAELDAWPGSDGLWRPHLHLGGPS